MDFEAFREALRDHGACFGPVAAHPTERYAKADRHRSEYARLWEALEGRGAIPDGWVGAPNRRFRSPCAACGGDKSVLAYSTTYRAYLSSRGRSMRDACQRCSPSGRSPYGRGWTEDDVPTDGDAAWSVVNGWRAMVEAEVLAAEAALRLGLRCVRFVWHVTREGLWPTTARRGLIGHLLRAMPNGPLAARMARDRAKAFTQRASFRLDSVGLEEWRGEGVPRPGNPFEPMAVMWKMGRPLIDLRGGEAVIFQPALVR